MGDKSVVPSQLDKRIICDFEDFELSDDLRGEC